MGFRVASCMKEQKNEVSRLVLPYTLIHCDMHDYEAVIWEPVPGTVSFIRRKKILPVVVSSSMETPTLNYSGLALDMHTTRLLRC